MKDKILLSEELSRHIKLKKKGNVFWGKCPFHEEDTPSFVVNDSKRFYYCFGCGAHGDIFKFYSDFLQKDFRETLESLGKDYGIPINFKKLNIATIESQEKIERILDKAKTIYRNNLINNKTALQYLKDRNISSVMMEKFQIGYSSESKIIKDLLGEGFSIDDLRKAGINSFGNLDRFRDRIMFPIIAKNQRVIGFSGRTIDGSNPKYLNSPETDIFQKNFHSYGENLLEPNKPAILVEGFLDVITLTQLGIPNVVASMGTAFSSGQALGIFRVTNSLILIFDGDLPGQEAVELSVISCLKILTPEKELFISTMPSNIDPDSLGQKKGLDGINSVLRQKKSVLQWKWDFLMVSFKRTPNSLAIILEKIDEFLKHISNSALRKSYKIFFDVKIFHLKRNLNIVPQPLRSMGPEDLVILILIKDFSLMEIAIEPFLDLKFQNKIYERIRVEIIEKLLFEKWKLEDLRELIEKKHDKTLKKLLNHNHFLYIIKNKGFALQYLIDNLCILRRLS